MNLIDILNELGKIVWLLLHKYYETMLWTQQTVTPTVGAPASFLVVGLVFVFVPLLVITHILSSAVSSTYSLFHMSWNTTIKILLIIIVVFIILYVLR